jgi:catechol 2,3-dioxygenase-like lactoylglutathione lyase family enzyme
MFSVSHIHHIAIICSDYSVSKHFYSELLGFVIIRETYRETRQSYKLDLAINETQQIELLFWRDCCDIAPLERRRRRNDYFVFWEQNMV